MNNKYFIHATYLSALLSAASCNSRPTFNIEVYDLESNCDGQTYLMIEHDPEPEVRSIHIEPDFLSAAQAAEISFEDAEHAIRVRFGSVTECMINTFSADRTVCYSPGSLAPSNQTSSLKLHSWRYPSRGPGYTEPYAKDPGDEVIQSDIFLGNTAPGIPQCVRRVPHVLCATANTTFDTCRPQKVDIPSTGPTRLSE